MHQHVIWNSRGGTSAPRPRFMSEKVDLGECKKRVWSLASKKLGGGWELCPEGIHLAPGVSWHMVPICWVVEKKNKWILLILEHMWYFDNDTHTQPNKMEDIHPPRCSPRWLLTSTKLFWWPMVPHCILMIPFLGARYTAYRLQCSWIKWKCCYSLTFGK